MRPRVDEAELDEVKISDPQKGIDESFEIAIWIPLTVTTA